MTDQGIVWQREIKNEAGKLTKELLDKLVAQDRMGFKNLSGAERKQITELTVNVVIRAMLRLGTFLTAGGGDRINCKLDQYVDKGGKPLKLTLLAEATPENIHALGGNAGKDVTVAFVNTLAFEQARDELMKAVHREQMDWLDIKDPELFPTDAGTVKAEAEAEQESEAQAVSELKAPQPGDYDMATIAGKAEYEVAVQKFRAEHPELPADPMAGIDEKWEGDDLSKAPAPISLAEHTDDEGVEAFPFGAGDAAEQEAQQQAAGNDPDDEEQDPPEMCVVADCEEPPAEGSELCQEHLDLALSMGATGSGDDAGRQQASP